MGIRKKKLPHREANKTRAFFKIHREGGKTGISYINDLKKCTLLL